MERLFPDGRVLPGRVTVEGLAGETPISADRTGSCVLGGATLSLGVTRVEEAPFRGTDGRLELFVDGALLRGTDVRPELLVEGRLELFVDGRLELFVDGALLRGAEVRLELLVDGRVPREDEFLELEEPRDLLDDDAGRVDFESFLSSVFVRLVLNSVAVLDFFASMSLVAATAPSTPRAKTNPTAMNCRYRIKPPHIVGARR